MRQLRSTVAHPIDRDPVELLTASVAPVRGRDHAHVVATFAQGQSERMQEGAGQVAGMTGVIVRHEDHDHA